MAGSLRAIKGKVDTWELRVYLGRDAEGRVRHRSARFHGSRRAAERELARLVVGQDAKPAPIPEDGVRWGPATTVNDAIAAWKDNGWGDLSPKTVRGYESTWKVHIAPGIGRRRIASLGTYDIERYFRSLKAAGLSAASVYQVKAVLHRACRLARKWSGGTLPNPAADADLPVWSLDERRPAVRAPEVDEVRRLLAVAAEEDDPRFGCFLRILAATGMRRGEACALRWSDVDLNLGVLRVDESVISAKGALVKGPKTRASIRRLAVDPTTVAELRMLRSEQDRLAGSAASVVAADSFVFSFVPGGATPPHPDAVTHAFDRLRSKAGVAADIHLHSLRHFHATAVDPVISEAQKQARLGWSTVQMARHYTDGLPAEDRRAAEHVGRLLGGGSTAASATG